MRRALAVAAVLALCLTGCTDDEKTPTGTTSSPPPTGPTDPTTGATPTTGGSTDGPPVLPDAAKAKTTAGAKAFVRYYVDVIDYTFVSQNTHTLRLLASKECSVCKSVVRGLARTQQRGGEQEGGTWSVRDVFLVPNQAIARSKLVAKIHISSGSWTKTSHGKEIPIKSQDLSNEFDLVWTDSGWRVRDLREA